MPTTTIQTSAPLELLRQIGDNHEFLDLDKLADGSADFLKGIDKLDEMRMVEFNRSGHRQQEKWFSPRDQRKHGGSEQESYVENMLKPGPGYIVRASRDGRTFLTALAAFEKLAAQS